MLKMLCIEKDLIQLLQPHPDTSIQQLIKHHTHTGLKVTPPKGLNTQLN